MKRFSTPSILGKIYITILLVIFGGIVLQGPISVGFGTLWPNYDLLIKSWKEILMLIDGVIVLFLLHKTKQFRILCDPIVIAIGLYATLHLLLVLFMNNGFKPSLAGLAIDLRYVFFFVLTYLGLRLYPGYKKTFIKVGIAGAVVVLVFAILQVFVLPIDVLKYIGYNIHTISPYLTVDQNPNFIRINSTLRGPNPLGAYALIILALTIAAISKYKVKKEKWIKILSGILSFGGIVALWFSYSRSALIGMILAVAVILLIEIYPRLSRQKKLLGLGVAIFTVFISAIVLVNNPTFISNVLLHENPDGGSSINSNEGHISSLQSGLAKFVQQPLGSGIGSTGSASLYTDNPTIIENQYLLIAHEAGWLGLLLFMFIFLSINVRLWKSRKDWLSLGLLASGVGLSFIGLLLPVWVDDTVSIVWWGLAAIVLSVTSKNKEL